MERILKISGYLVLIGLAVAFAVGMQDAHKEQARESLLKAGYSPATVDTMEPIMFGCMKGRYGYTIRTENGGRVKICVGGLMSDAISPQ